MQSYNIRRKIGSITVTENGFATLDLPRVYDYQTLFLRINGSVVVSTAGDAVRADAPCQLVPRVEIIANGKNNLVSAPFNMLCRGNVWRNGQQYGARSVTPPSSHTAATYAVEALAAVDFCTIDGVRPKDSNYRSAGLDLLQLRLTFGQAEDLFTGSPVGTLSGMTVDVWTAETVELPDASGAYSMPLALKKVSYQEVALTSTNANQEIRLPASNYIRAVQIRAEIDGEPSNAVINNVQLASGIDVRYNMSAAQLRAINNMDYGQVPTGYYVIDPPRNGPENIKLADCWDVTGQSEPKLILDVTGGAGYKVQIVTTEYLMGAK